MAQKRLGKGLESLFNNNTPVIEKIDNAIVSGIGKMIPTSEIIVNKEQPRTYFEQEKINSLAESIKEHGIMQPIVVTKVNEGYKIISGERRYKASQKAKLKEIPAIVKSDEVSDLDLLRLGLIENLQREDLNEIELCKSFNTLSDTYKLSQEDIANLTSLGRSTVANIMRLKDLPETIKQSLVDNEISLGHCKLFLSIKDTEEMLDAFDAVHNNDLTVKELASYIKNNNKNNKEILKKEKDLHVSMLEEKISDKLSSNVNISTKNKGGTIKIEFYSNEHLDTILKLLDVEVN